MTLMRNIRLLAAFLLVTLAALMPSTASAQSSTVSWSTAGVGNGKKMPNPATATASDGTGVTLSYSSTTNGGSFVPVYDNSFLTYSSGRFGSSSGGVLIAFDNDSWDPADKIITTITLGRAVTGLSLSINDINRGTGSVGSWGTTFRDVVMVEYDTGSGSFQSITNSSSLWSAGSAITQRGSTFIGEQTSDQTSTSGTLDLHFGDVSVKRIRITFNSDTSGWFDAAQPESQQIAISALAFDAPGADLSLSKTRVSGIPTNGGSVTWRLTVSNSSSSSLSASGVTVKDYFPAGFTFSSASGTGTFAPQSNVWRVGKPIAPGQDVSLDITGTISATPGAPITNYAEIITSNAPDSDSTPGNGVTTEDDYASITFTVAGTRAAGIAPALTCPAGSVLFDWDSKSWAAGSTNNFFQLDVIGPIGFQISNPGNWLSDRAYGGQAPILQTISNGGKTGERLLFEWVDLPNRNARVVTQITLPTVMRGAQFMIADVDYWNGQFADYVEVEGLYQGATVIPTLTNGATNYVIGNSAYGDGLSSDGAADGNVIVTFDQSIDQIIIRYGNHSLAPSNPGQQGIAIHDILFCRPTTTLVTIKTSRILNDPINGTNNPKMIPGATVEYCVLVKNTGDTVANNIRASDSIPDELTYASGSMTSGVTCASATTAEDDDSSSADESDPIGASIEGANITMTADSLDSGATMAVKFQTKIN